MNRRLAVVVTLLVAAGSLTACGSTAKPAVVVVPTKTAVTTAMPTSAEPVPAAPNSPSTLESAGGTPTTLLLQQVGSGSGDSKSFTPTGSVAPSQAGPGSAGMARLRVEWKCAPGGAVTNVHLEDGSGDISGPLTNGFDGPIPVGQPAAKVVWSVTGSCGWHVRALNQV